MSLNNFIPDDGSLWSIRAVEISGNYNQKLTLDAAGNAIVRTGNTDRLTINSSGAWTCQGGMSYNNSTNALTAGTFSGAATNLSGGLGGQIPYQSATSTTALLANGTSRQFLISNGGTSAPSWSTPSVTTGNFQFDDMWSCSASNNGPLGMQQQGTFAIGSPSSLGATDGYNGITRVTTLGSGNNNAAWYSGSGTLFRNLLINGGGMTLIFRPFPINTTTNVTCYAGFGSDFSNGNPTNGLFWRYSTNVAQPTNSVWNLVQDGTSVYTCIAPMTGTLENSWLKVSVIRTSSLTYTASLQNLTTSDPAQSFSGTLASSNINLHMGIYVACNSIVSPASKTCDIDYISCEFNSTH